MDIFTKTALMQEKPRTLKTTGLDFLKTFIATLIETDVYDGLFWSWSLYPWKPEPPEF